LMCCSISARGSPIRSIFSRWCSLAKRSFLIALRFFMVLTGRMMSGCLMLSQSYRSC